MKTKLCLLGIFALVPLAIAAPHTWILSTGKTVVGDYVSSGTTTLVVKTGGTNCFLAISNLSTNDLAYVAQNTKPNQKQARLDAEDKTDAVNPWTVLRKQRRYSIIFQKKLIIISRVDGRRLPKPRQHLANVESQSGPAWAFGIRDKNGDSFSRCIVHKTGIWNAATRPVVVFSNHLNLKRR